MSGRWRDPVPVLFKFPLWKKRGDDRNYAFPSSPLNQAVLSVPPEGGRIRLCVTIPWGGLPDPRRLHILAIALTWRKSLRLPSSQAVAEATWKALQGKRYRRTTRPALDCFPIKVGPWRAEAFTWETHRPLLAHLPKDDALVNLQSALEWTSRLLTRRWSRKGRGDWLLRAHRLTALLVADEIATLYFDDRTRLVNAAAVEQAEPQLLKRIRAAYRAPRLTPRRLALALVDAKFEGVHPSQFSILDPNRQMGLDDGQLWRRLIPEDHEQRMREGLWPAPSVRELLGWSAEQTREDQRADWLLRWWHLLRDLPLKPLLCTPAPRPGELPPSPRNFLQQLPGTEDWAARVWDALYR